MNSRQNDGLVKGRDTDGGPEILLDWLSHRHWNCNWGTSHTVSRDKLIAIGCGSFLSLHGDRFEAWISPQQWKKTIARSQGDRPTISQSPFIAPISGRDLSFYRRSAGATNSQLAITTIKHAEYFEVGDSWKVRQNWTSASRGRLFFAWTPFPLFPHFSSFARSPTAFSSVNTKTECKGRKGPAS